MFIPLAEQHELIIPLTRYLMNTVTENLQLFPPRPSFYISINVAAEHFKTLNIIDDIRQIWLPAHPMPSLMLELTERTALSAIQYDQIRTLKDMGIMLAIDDFGTGHSSLSYLKNLSPDVLKIDRGFTAAIGTDAVNATVTDTIITLAQRLKLKLVAEGWKRRNRPTICAHARSMPCRGIISPSRCQFMFSRCGCSSTNRASGKRKRIRRRPEPRRGYACAVSSRATRVTRTSSIRYSDTSTISKRRWFSSMVSPTTGICP